MQQGMFYFYFSQAQSLIQLLWLVVNVVIIIVAYVFSAVKHI